MSDLKPPPPCVGTYEQEHVQCDGDAAADSFEERSPCAWRDRCVALQLYSLEHDKEPEEVVAAQDLNGLVQLCDTYVEKHGIERGRTAEERVDEEPSSEEVIMPPVSKKRRVPPQRKNGPKKRRARLNQIGEDMAQLHAHFVDQLRERFPDRRFANGARVLVRPGTFYPIDRTEGSAYISWYCTTERGRDAAIACVRFKPGLGTVDIELPVELDRLQGALGKRTFKRLNAKPIHDGQFRTLCMHLDLEGVGLCVESIRRMVDDGILRLPETR